MKYLLEYDDATDSLLISDVEERLAFVITGERIRRGFNPKEIKENLEFLTDKVTQQRMEVFQK